MKQLHKIISLLTITISIACTSMAQVNAARTAMERLYVRYDSTPYITFDVKYTYTSDTSYGDYTHDEMVGTYTMSGRKAKFSLGEVEYMQNDSFFIAAYHRDKIIIVSHSRQSVAGQYMPLRAAIDSLLTAYASHYTINVQDVNGDSTGYVQFTRADSLAAFDFFKIGFDKDNNAISRVEYTFYEPVPEDPNLPTLVAIPPRRKTLTIDFLNYRFDNFSNSVYAENNYIWMEDGVLKPVAKMEGYKIYDAR